MLLNWLSGALVGVGGSDISLAKERATLAQLQQSLIKSLGPVEARLAGFEQEVKGKACSFVYTYIYIYIYIYIYHYVLYISNDQ